MLFFEMKRVLLIFLFFVFWGVANATDQPRIVVHLADNTSMEVLLQEMPIVKFINEKLKIETSMNLYEFDRNNVVKFEFKGDVDGVEKVQHSDFNLVHVDNMLKFQNLPMNSEIEVFSADGILLFANVVEGNYILMLDDFSQGIYIVRVNGISTKIAIKQ